MNRKEFKSVLKNVDGMASSVSIGDIIEGKNNTYIAVDCLIKDMNKVIDALDKIGYNRDTSIVKDVAYTIVYLDKNNDNRQ